MPDVQRIAFRIEWAFASFSASNGPYYGTVGRPQLRYSRLVNYDSTATVKESE